MAVIYFLKLNINKDIHDIYKEGDNKMAELLENIYNSISSTKHIMRKNEKYKNSNGEKKEIEIQYEMRIFKNDYSEQIIAGDFIKSNVLFANQKKNNRLVTVPVENYDAIRFYFDVRNEIIAFYTATRFGYKQFMEFFQDYLNEVLTLDYSDNKKNIKRYVVLRNIKINFSLTDFYESLLDKGNIEEISFSIIPPNASEEYLNNLDKMAKAELKDFEDANITSINEKLLSETGFNMKSEVLMKKFKKFDKINNIIKEEQKNKENINIDYVDAYAKNAKGEFFSTSNSNYKRDIEDKDKNEDEFVKKAKSFILQIKSQLL